MRDGMPVRWSAHLARSLRFMRNIRGWPPVATALAGRRGSYEVENRGIRFAGDLATQIEREIFVFGGYDRDRIDLFLGRAARRGLILDVGANVGNHSLSFARHFDRVVSFEPNPAILATLERNIALNPGVDVEVWTCGLGDVAAELPLFVPRNHGLSTFLAEEVIEAEPHLVRIEVGDELGIAGPVDAIKIDVQGYEAQVLRGLRRTIDRDRPLIWVEISATAVAATSRTALADLLPVPFDLSLFATERAGVITRTRLIDHHGEHLPLGDYLIRPKGY
jgi:FkbM family methyltransferase